MQRTASKTLAWFILSVTSLLLMVSCGDKATFTATASSETFTQDYNPAYLNLLWVIDDRSPMFRVRDHLTSEAERFFQRLDASANQYQMAFTNAFNGTLEPSGAPEVLFKNKGTLQQRLNNFADILSQIINLRTGPIDQGFLSAQLAITNNSSKFKLQRGVPLVLIFVSDSDDHSPTEVVDAVTAYKNYFLSLVGNDPNLIKAYAINYKPLAGGATPDPTNRCATQFDADIDQPGFQNRYFLLAQALGGDTADLCGSFADKIDLTGLRLKQLKTRFKLSVIPNPSSLMVLVSSNGQVINNLHWFYDIQTNEIAFDVAPAEGALIQVSYSK